MDDKGFLELAAKAVGRTIKRNYLGTQDARCPWNPLEDDGDALRLAVELMMSVEISEHEGSTYAYAGEVPRVCACEMWLDDKDAATRRAIVRAAAEIGKGVVTPNAGSNGPSGVAAKVRVDCRVGRQLSRNA